MIAEVMRLVVPVGAAQKALQRRDRDRRRAHARRQGRPMIRCSRCGLRDGEFRAARLYVCLRALRTHPCAHFSDLQQRPNITGHSKTVANTPGCVRHNDNFMPGYVVRECSMQAEFCQYLRDPLYFVNEGECERVMRAC